MAELVVVVDSRQLLVPVVVVDSRQLLVPVVVVDSRQLLVPGSSMVVAFRRRRRRCGRFCWRPEPGACYVF
jgi:hypothetical protein